MFFFFVCGEHTFRSDVEGFEGLTVQCFHCGNMAAHVVKSRPFFTVCWIPLIPHTISGYKDVACNICNFHQPLESRQDVLAMANGGNGQMQNQGYQMQPPPQGGPQGPPNGQKPNYG
ncbi:Putative Rhodopsin family protein [[Torrubiella] hemipterigena]|uniref:Putative Rhodopsin family protein n=1 Tax=[Torrubiella] hemipterigena TaxID=1531966 RepID=A0A0A1SWA8_9HYPO|nr:Putative Rhodopsin family protein [[Torrubiella] hemipterigena]